MDGLLNWHWLNPIDSYQAVAQLSGVAASEKRLSMTFVLQPWFIIMLYTP